jgi:dsRNA-specific ribonuclease
MFCIEVSFENYISTKAESSTVKEAEKLAATKFIESNKI